MMHIKFCLFVWHLNPNPNRFPFSIILVSEKIKHRKCGPNATQHRYNKQINKLLTEQSLLQLNPLLSSRSTHKIQVLMPQAHVQRATLLLLQSLYCCCYPHLLASPSLQPIISWARLESLQYRRVLKCVYCRRLPHDLYPFFLYLSGSRIWKAARRNGRKF